MKFLLRGEGSAPVSFDEWKAPLTCDSFINNKEIRFYCVDLLCVCVCVFVAGIDTPKTILGDPGAVRRAGRKGATKVFKHPCQILHLDKKAAKCTTFKQLCGEF